MLQCQTQDVGSGLILGVMNMGSSLGLGSFFVGPDIWGQGSLSVLSLWKKLAWFSAETETWVRRICRGLDEGQDPAWSGKHQKAT